MAQALTRKQRFWRDHIQAAKRDQQTYADYAKQHNLNLKALYYWSMTLRRRGVLEQPAPAFVELKVKRASSVRPEASSTTSARVRLANGVELELSDSRSKHCDGWPRYDEVCRSPQSLSASQASGFPQTN